MENEPNKELDSVSVGIHLSYIRQSIAKIEGTLSEMKSVYVSRSEYDEVKKIQEDHESRIRDNSTNITKVMTWGSALVVGASILQFIISSYFSSN